MRYKLMIFMAGADYILEGFPSNQKLTASPSVHMFRFRAGKLTKKVKQETYQVPLVASRVMEYSRSSVHGTMNETGLFNGHTNGHSSSPVSDRLKSIDSAMSWIRGELVRTVDCVT